MKKNMGALDKAVRLAIVAVVAILYFTHVVSGIVGIILLAIAAILLLTSLINFCPIWALLGISTGKKESDSAEKK
jgi:hypothetical protein